MRWSPRGAIGAMDGARRPPPQLVAGLPANAQRDETRDNDAYGDRDADL